jgi:hypothetical protein
MRTLMLVATLALWGGCAHQRRDQNLARRQEVTTPRSDFEGVPGDAPREREIQRVEKPIVTPPVP